jgi:hypothetical protein
MQYILFKPRIYAFFVQCGFGKIIPSPSGVYSYGHIVRIECLTLLSFNLQVSDVIFLNI